MGEKTFAQMKESGDTRIGRIRGDDAIQKAEMAERWERDGLEVTHFLIKDCHLIFFNILLQIVT